MDRELVLKNVLIGLISAFVVIVITMAIAINQPDIAPPDFFGIFQPQAELTCRDCHEKQARLNTHGFFSCEACHNKVGGHEKIHGGIKEGSSRTPCVSCHSRVSISAN